MNGEWFEDPYAGIPLGTTTQEYEAMIGAPAGAIFPTAPPVSVAPAGVGVGAGAGVLAGAVPAALAAIGVPAAIAGLGGLAAGYLLGEGGQPGSPTDIAVAGNGGGAALPGIGLNREAFLDFGGIGKYGREGMVNPTRTTEGTGFIAAGTFRAWDPIKQRYYQLEGDQAFRGISFTPGSLIPGAGYITKAWVNSAWRRDGSLASTQMGMTSDGRMISLSETGVMKQWRPYKSIVLGKSMRAGTIRRFANRIDSHAKSLRKVLKNIK